MKRLLFFLGMVCFPIMAHAGVIPITGTVRLANGSLMNGSIQFVLSYSAARDTCSSNIVVAQTITWPVNNGALPANAVITGNDCLQPANTWYTARYLSAAGAVLAQNLFYIQGTSFNIGTAIPTPVTTNNLSFSQLTAVTRVNNTRLCDAFPGASADAKIANCIADLPSSGGVADATGIVGSQTIAADPFAAAGSKTGILRLGCSVTYAMTSYITVPSNWTIQGCGQSTLLSAASGLPNIPGLSIPGIAPSTASAMIYVQANATHVKIEKLNLHGPFTSGTSGTTFGLFAGAGSTDVQFLNNIVTNASWSGIFTFSPGSNHLIQGNYTSANAVDGIESWATQSNVSKNFIVNDSISSNSATACIELGGRQTPFAIDTSNGTIVEGNTCINSGAVGVSVSSSGGTGSIDVKVRGNYILNSASRPINVQTGWANVEISGNTIDTSTGSGALGNGIDILDTTFFSVIGNHVRHTNVSTGPAGIQVEGAASNGIVANNVIDDSWVGISVTGTAGTTGTITVAGNTITNIGSGTFFSNTSTSGAKVFTPYNALGSTTLTSILPTLIVPQLYGGTTTTSNIAISGTTVNGAATSAAILFTVGNASTTEAGRICNNGNWTINNPNCSLENFAIVDKSFGVRSSSSNSADAIINLQSQNNLGNLWQFAAKNTGHFQIIDQSVNQPILDFLPQIGGVVVGGSATTATIAIQGTNGNGTATSPAILFNVGNNGATQSGQICNNGNWALNSTNCGLEYFSIVDKTASVRSDVATDATFNMINSNGSGINWQFQSQNTGHWRLTNTTSGPTVALEVDGSGHVGIGTLAAATAATVCFDTTTLTGRNTLTTCSSLRRLKRDIHPLPSDLKEFMRLNPVSYVQRNDGVKRWGFIAEDVNAVNPTLSNYYRGELNGVDYNGITALLVKVVQDLQTEVDQLKAKLPQ